MKTSEFQFINLISQKFGQTFANEKGIGDDCASIPFSNTENYLITTDALIEGVHFTLDTISFHDLGWKSIAVNLSDIAAMGAVPKYLFITIAVPKNLLDEDMLHFHDGVYEISKQYNVLLLGGDTTGSLNELCISVTAIGIAGADKILYRSGANQGDYIYVTGTLGDSSAGLALLAGQIKTDNINRTTLINRHILPGPRIEEMLYLKENYNISSAIDISDGLSSDLTHILEGSQVGAEIDWHCLPISQALLNTIDQENLDRYIFHGGEDYEILFTSPDEINTHQFFNKTNTLLSRIGNITATGKLVLNKHNKKEVLLPDGFDHFS